MDVEVRQNGNRFELEFDGRTIFFDVSGHDCAPSTPADFAVWATLPFAMRKGADLHIRGEVDPAVVANARKLARISAMWIPEAYSPIRISVDKEVVPPPPPTPGKVMLYSGGVDSTFAMLRENAEGGLAAALTVHGMDYSYNPTFSK